VSFFLSNYSFHLFDILLFTHLFFSGVYEKAETKGRQTLLRRRANHIADYEALHHIHFWEKENDPKYIYYFGQSKTFEEWNKSKKDDQGAIYKELEEKSTFTKRNFEKRDYDDHSIWKYNIAESEIEGNETMKNNWKVNIENLSKKINQKERNDDEINKINKKIDELIEEIEKIGK
jgi:hypothetical protein